MRTGHHGSRKQISLLSMSMQLRGQIKPTYKMPRFENGHQGDPTIGFDTSRDTGIYHDDGLCITHHGTRVMQIGQVITVDAPIVGDASGLSNVSAANVVGLTAALDVIDASSVSSNVFIGNGAGLSNIAAGNIVGLDTIDASSVTSNTIVCDTITSNDSTINGNLSGTEGNVILVGNLVVTADVISLASDRRLKTNLIPINGALDTVKNLTGYKFTWRNDIPGLQLSGVDIGLMAQDVRDAGIHEAVALAPFDTDPTSGSSKSAEAYLTIKYEKLHAVTIEAIKELSMKIESLQQRIDQMEQQL
jgi:hypothetical protein